MEMIGKVFASRLIENPKVWTYDRVPQKYRDETKAALGEKLTAGVITEARLAEILGE